MKQIKEDSYENTFHANPSLAHSEVGNSVLLESLYETDEMARRIVDVIPEEMLSPGFNVVGLDDDSDFKSRWTELRADQEIADALCWARLFGRGAIMLMLDDNRSLVQPATPGSRIESIRVYDKREITVFAYENSSRNPRFGMPKVYEIRSKKGRTFKVHFSRIHVIEGSRLPNRNLNVDGSDSGATCLSSSVRNAIHDYNRSHDLATRILRRKQQVVWGVNDLADLCENDDGKAAARKRLAQIGVDSGIDAPIGIDKETETYEVLNSDISGIPEFLSMKMDRIVELTGIHEIILRNKNTGGVSASQNTALQTFYKMIDRKRKDDLQPILEFMIPFMIDDAEWHIEFGPMSIPTDSEKADILQKTSVALNTFVTNQTIDVEEARDTIEAMGIGIKLKENPGDLPSRDDILKAKAQAKESITDNPDQQE